MIRRLLSERLSGSEPLLVAIAMDTAEVKTDLKHLAVRVEEIHGRVSTLEKVPRPKLPDILPWIYGCVLLALALSGKLELQQALSLLKQ